LVRILTGQGHRCFCIEGTVGLSGFVFAKGMAVRARPSKWMGAVHGSVSGRSPTDSSPPNGQGDRR
jgi:hypothetical protein